MSRTNFNDIKPKGKLRKRTSLASRIPKKTMQSSEYLNLGNNLSIVAQHNSSKKPASSAKSVRHKVYDNFHAWCFSNNGQWKILDITTPICFPLRSLNSFIGLDPKCWMLSTNYAQNRVFPLGALKSDSEATSEAVPNIMLLGGSLMAFNMLSVLVKVLPVDILSCFTKVNSYGEKSQLLAE